MAEFFSDSQLLLNLEKMTFWIMDGTFNKVAQHFYQLYSILAFNGESARAELFALLPDKQEKTYQRLVDVLKRKLVPIGNPRTLLVDFELAAINAFSSFQDFSLFPFLDSFLLTFFL